MSYRYELSIHKDNKELEYIQLFRNMIIPEIHEYISDKFNLKFIDDDCDFEVELDSDTLNELYKIIDNYCYNYAKKDLAVNSYIDLLYDYNKYNYDDFGLANIDIAANNLIVLQSAALNLFLTRSENIIGYCHPFKIGEGINVLFRFS
jgi:hypothetical protein